MRRPQTLEEVVEVLRGAIVAFKDALAPLEGFPNDVSPAGPLCVSLSVRLGQYAFDGTVLNKLKERLAETLPVRDHFYFHQTVHHETRLTIGMHCAPPMPLVLDIVLIHPVSSNVERDVKAAISAALERAK